jgi:glucose/arabinose dehydrogenase/endonuclease YncB( thermonuclease family)
MFVMVGRHLFLGLIILSLAIGFVPIRADAQRLPPGGAPPPGSGPKDVDGFVRVISGDTIEAYVDGQRTGIGLIGIEAPPANTDCGRQATARLWSLVKGGVHLEEDPGQSFDHRSRRMYHVKTRDGRPIADELARDGVVRASGKGKDKQRIADAAEDADKAGRGCATRPVSGLELDLEHEGVFLKATGAQTLGLDASDTVQAMAGADDPAGTAMAVAAAPAAATVPGGFTEDVLANGQGTNGLDRPTAFVFLPDGRILIAQQNGVVRVFKNGALLPTPFIDIQNRVNDFWDHGLLGIAADPNFATNGFVYLLYTYENNAADYEGKKSSRLARYTASGDTAAPNTELVLLGSVVGAGCESQLMADCIPSEYSSHSIGNVKFASDGTLFVTTGDGSSFNEVDDRALRAQNLDSLAGKMLRITNTGAGISTNPFWNGNPNANRSKVWAYGLRNSYRFNLQPGSDDPYYGDVGWNSTEEISVAKKGANMGWPCYEGPAQQTGYASKSVCQALYNQGATAHREPLISWGHNFGGTCCSSAATGGTFYSATAYPAQFQGAYFYADYGKDWIRYLRVDANDNLVAGSDTGFATGAGGPVDLELGPDGNLYYLSIESQELRRIRFTGGTNQPPTASLLANPFAGLKPLNVQFTGSGSTDPNGDPLTFLWSFGDGTPNSTQANPQHSYANDGVYTASLTVTDGRGGTDTETLTITVGNEPPTATINSPSSSLHYKVGDVITFSGSATDPETGPIPASALSWRIFIHHCPGGQCHQHVLKDDTGVASGSFTVPDHGDDSHFEIRLTATDAIGLTDTATVTLQPQTVQVTLASAPTGLQLIYDSSGDAAPLTRTTVPGSEHTIQAPHQGSNQFASWSDGGAQAHNITVGATNATYTATFVQLPVVTFDDKAGQNQPLNGQYPSNVIDWGTGKWYHSGPWGPLTTKSISFEDGGITSATFNFVAPRKLVSVQVYNGGGATTVSLSCAGQTTKTQAIAAGVVTTVETNWTGTCTTVTLASTNGWDTNFDNLVYDSGGAPPPDTTAPVISAVQAGSITTTGATISWTTNEASDTQVEYGTTITYGSSTTLAPAMVTAHSQAVSGLQPNTLYHYRVKSKDAAGNLATSGDFTFTTATASPPDTTPPVISAVQAGSITSSGATITWTTNEAADRQVEYGPTTAYGTSVPTPPGTPPGTSHSVPLSGLQPNALYHYRVKSRDAAGNPATSADFTFTTAAASANQTVTFDDKAGQDQALNGQYPSGVINWGTNNWYHSGPWGAFTTKSISFNGGGITSQTFTFMTARKLVSVKVFNGGGAATTVTISCNGQTKSQSVPAGQAVTITTGFAATCTTVTLGSTNGWDTNFDDLVHAAP